jgi:hypothetical protein
LYFFLRSTHKPPAIPLIASRQGLSCNDLATLDSMGLLERQRIIALTPPARAQAQMRRNNQSK